MWFRVEYTDTFGGEANYSWVRRARFEAPESITDRDLVARAKRELGLTGVRCRRETWGETIVLRPVGQLTIMFIDADVSEGFDTRNRGKGRQTMDQDVRGGAERGVCDHVWVCWTGRSGAVVEDCAICHERRRVDEEV